MHKSYKAIIFDLDGTLFDSIQDITDSANHVLEEQGYPTHEVDKYISWIGNGALKLVERSLPEEVRTEDLIRETLVKFRKTYSSNWGTKSRLYKGIPEVLDYLKLQKIPISVLSNKPHDITAQIANCFLIGWNFSFVLGQRDDVPKKPDPTVSLEIARELNVSASEVLFIGDSNTDIRTAKNAGMIPLGVSWGYGTKEDMLEAGAGVIVDKSDQLLEYLRK